MVTRKAWLWAPVTVALVAAGCTNQPGEILNDIYLDAADRPGPSLTTGARQRLISNTTTGVASTPGRVHPSRIICVEPSPDVAVVIANSFGLGGGLFEKGSGSLTHTQAEGIAQIAERTVSIQALLKQGYQACLDYANGAISGTTYSLRTSRLDDLLVTLVLAENAAGAFGRSGAALAGKSSADAEAQLTNLSKASGDVDELREDLAMAETEVNEKKATVAIKEKAINDLTEDAPETEKRAKQAELDDATGQLRAAEARRNAILRQLQSSIDSLSKSASEVSTATGRGQLTARPDAKVASILGEMQARFLAKDIDQAYFSACLTELGHRKIPTSQDELFRQVVYEELTAGKPTGKPIDALKMEAFFLGSHLGDETKLTTHCEENIERIVELSIENQHDLRLREHDLKLRELELEHARITMQAAAARTVVHPSATLNRLREEVSTLKENIEKLKDLAVPADAEGKLTEDVRAALAAEKAAHEKKVDELLKLAENATTTDGIENVTDLENRYLMLVADVRKEGTAVERKLWQAEFDLQQAKAEAKEEQLAKLSHEVTAATHETVELIDRTNSAIAAANE